MSRGELICQEFCDNVLVSTRIRESEDQILDEIEELKCTMDIDQFDVLSERMVDSGYCCTQVQNDIARKKCVVWFEPILESHKFPV